MTSKKKKDPDAAMEKAEAATPSGPSKDGSEEDYEARNAMEDISRAHEHMQNPDMMARVQKHVGRKMKALQGIKSIKDLRGVYDEKFGSGAVKRLQNPRDKA